MPYVKDSLSLLVEAGSVDINYDTKSILTESAVRNGYSKIKCVSENFVYGPEMVTVVKIGDEYFTEMSFLKPYMESNGIKSISEALNNIAYANNLDTNNVGLLIECDDNVTSCINKALESGSPKQKKNAFDKIAKAINLADKLEEKGIKVRKKPSKKKK